MKILQDVIAPQDNANDELVTIVAMPFADGAKVTAGTLILEYENSKAVVEVRAEVDGYLRYFCARDQELPLGTRLLQVLDEPSTAPAAGRSETRATASGSGAEPRFSRAAAALIDAHRLPAARFAGRDFVTAGDVLKTVAPAAAIGFPGPASAVEAADLRVTVEPLSAEKKTEVRYLADLQPGDLNSTVFVEIAVAALNAYVAKTSPFFKKSILPLVVKEVHDLLAKYSQFNAYYAAGNICCYREVALGLSVDFGAGLRVITLAGLAGRSLKDVEVTLVKQMQRCYKGQLTPAELSGSTFTITDLSQEGALFFTPLINRRQSAILALAAPSEARGTQMIGLTFDHRVASGRDAAQFLRELKTRLESYPGAAVKSIS